VKLKIIEIKNFSISLDMLKKNPDIFFTIQLTLSELHYDIK